MKYVSHSGRLGTALRILAGIVRWTWRLCSIALTLFCLVFLLAGLSQGIHVSRDPSDLAHIVAVLILFAGMVVAWWREGLGGLISLLGCFIFAGITTIVNWHNGIRAGARGSAAVDALILIAPHAERQHGYPEKAPPCPHRRAIACSDGCFCCADYVPRTLQSLTATTDV
jgi:hypothetical protein